MVEPYPSEKWWSESQLGTWHSQLNGKIIQIFQTTNQIGFQQSFWWCRISQPSIVGLWMCAEDISIITMRYWHDNEMMANQGRLLAAFIPEMGMFIQSWHRKIIWIGKIWLLTIEFMVNQFLDKATVDIGSGIIFCGNYVACFGLGMWKKSAVLEVRGQSCYIM